MLINYTMWSSDFFLHPVVSRVFHSSEFSESTFFRIQVFLSPGFSGPGFSESRFFWVHVSQGPDPGSGSRVWAQVLEVNNICSNK